MQAALFKAAWRTGDTTLTPLTTQLLSSAGIHSPPTNVNNKSQSERFYEVCSSTTFTEKCSYDATLVYNNSSYGQELQETKV